MIKKRLKDWVLPAFGVFVALGSIFCYYLLTYLINYEKNYTNSFVTDSLIEETITVNDSMSHTIIKPFISENVTISKYYYQSTDDNERQTNSLIKYQNIYMPNTGILYTSTEEFDVISIANGKVTSIKEDEILGYIVEVEHSNNLVSIYQSVKDVVVAEGQEISQGDIVAKSGTNNLEDSSDNNLHFEVYKDGTLLNPETIYNIEIENIN